MLERRLGQVLEQVDCSVARHRAGTVALMLAVKRQSAATCADAARALADAGRPVLLGHNHVQEARATQAAIRDAGVGARIHLIGHLQTNKINAALDALDAIDTLDSPRLARALNQRVRAGRVLDVLIQVNTSGEPTKSGVAPADAAALADTVAECERLALRGLMTIGAHTTDEAEVRASYARLAHLRDQIRATHPGCRELSMGMSGDFDLAIAEGATIIRIGQAVLGPREK